MVCASNQNRSMEAHALLATRGYQVQSYGTSSQIKLPGAAADQPNIYAFGTSYQQMHAELQQADAKLYARNGVLAMLQRNMGIKHAPQRWQESSECFDCIVTFEERVVQSLIADMMQREQRLMQPCLVINLEVVDNHREAGKAAPHALRLCEMLEQSADWQEGLESILAAFEQETGRSPVYDIIFC